MTITRALSFLMFAGLACAGQKQATLSVSARPRGGALPDVRDGERDHASRRAGFGLGGGRLLFPAWEFQGDLDFWNPRIEFQRARGFGQNNRVP